MLSKCYTYLTQSNLVTLITDTVCIFVAAFLSIKSETATFVTYLLMGAMILLFMLPRKIAPIKTICLALSLVCMVIVYFRAKVGILLTFLYDNVSIVFILTIVAITALRLVNLYKSRKGYSKETFEEE